MVTSGSDGDNSVSMNIMEMPFGRLLGDYIKVPQLDGYIPILKCFIDIEV